MKLENIKQRLLNGEKVKNTRLENGSYIVQMTNGPEVTFDDNYKEIVDKTIVKASGGQTDHIDNPGPVL